MTGKRKGYMPAVAPDEDPATSLDHFPVPSETLVQVINDAVAQAIADGDRTRFDLRSPCMLTVKTAHDSYKKETMHSGVFELTAARVGKRMPVILVFKPCFVSDYRAMEMSVSDAEQHLSGFENWFQIVLAWAEGKGQQKSRRKKAAEPEPTAPVYVEGIFGSW